MSHLYPLAFTARQALAGSEHGARSKADASRLCPHEGHHISELETEWLTLAEDESADLEPLAEAGVTAGFVQRYEDAKGATVLAVSYWKIVPDNAPETAAEPEPDPAPETNAAPEPDHTDDLYFRAGRTKKRRKARKVDPNQMDLFGKVEE